MLVVALGGNAISREGDEPSVAAQYVRTRETARLLAPLLTSGDWRAVITHGNGPQVGNILLRSDLAAEARELPRLPVDAAVADTQGAMGYMIQQCLWNGLRAVGADLRTATVVTRVVVDADDPAFENPTKPIGRHYPADQADEVASLHGWQMEEDAAGRGFRRVIASPRPHAIIEVDVVRHLLDRDVVVIACGGGGVPVVREPSGDLTGVDAVVDKDLASSLLARELGASAFAIVTDVEHVYADFGTPQARALEEVDAAELRAMVDAGSFPAGSMGPKVEAVLAFLERNPAGNAVITSPERLVDALAGRGGTRVRTARSVPAAPSP